MSAHPYQTILAIIGNVFDAHAAMLFLPLPENKSQVSLVSAWSPTQVIREDTIIESGKSYVGFVMRDYSETSLIVNYTDIVHSNFPYYDENRMPEIKTFLAVPVAGGGVLVMDSLEEDAFNEDAQNVFALFARLIPQIQTMTATSSYSLQLSTYFYALETIRVLKEKKLPWLKFIKSILKITSEATGLEYAVFVSKTNEGASHVVEAENVPLLLSNDEPLELAINNANSHAGLIAWVLKNEENIYNDGFTQASTPLFTKIKDFPSFNMTISIAIKVDNETCGVLSIASQIAKPISQEMRVFAQLVAAEISQYLEKLTMRHRLSLALKN